MKNILMIIGALFLIQNSIAQKEKTLIDISEVKNVYYTYHIGKIKYKNFIEGLRTVIYNGELSPASSDTVNFAFNEFAAQYLITWNEADSLLDPEISYNEILLKQINIVGNDNNLLFKDLVGFCPLKNGNNLYERMTAWFIFPALAPDSELSQTIAKSSTKKTELVNWEFESLQGGTFTMSQFYTPYWYGLDSYIIDKTGSYEEIAQYSTPKVNIAKDQITSASYTYKTIQFNEANDGLFHKTDLNIGGLSFGTLVLGLINMMDIQWYSDETFQNRLGIFMFEGEDLNKQFNNITSIQLIFAKVKNEHGEVLLEEEIGIKLFTSEKSIGCIYYPEFRSDLYNRLLQGSPTSYVDFFDNSLYDISEQNEIEVDKQDAINALLPYIEE